MSKVEQESRLEEIALREEYLRRRLNELEDLVQDAPGSHRPGQPSLETIEAEREIQGVVLELRDLDRKRQEVCLFGFR
jgi:hypothetical protein